MRKLILIVHTSLDGYVAGTKGDFEGFDPSEENLEFVCKLTENADAALFGRKSFQLLESDWPTVKDRPGASESQISYSTWYNKAKKIVVSTTLQITNSKDIVIINKNITEEIIKIKNEPGNEILIFGSPKVSQLLMQNDLIDSYWIFLYPVIFGKGIPLFKEFENSIKLKLQSTHQLSKGEMVVNYIPLKTTTQL